MASNAPAKPKPTKAALSYEEISKLFSLPIAEAASILGVCTNVLKRICRSHGIVRWPYRKTISGKAGDDSKNSAKELLELSEATKPFSSSGSSPMSSSTPQAAAKSQHGVSKAVGQISPPGKQNASSGLALVSQTRDIPTFMDDFKHGFPSSGLSCETMKWWGDSSPLDSAAPAKDINHESATPTHDASKGMTDDELDWGADEEGEADSIITTAEPSAQLCSLRRKAVDDGRKLLNSDSYRGQQVFSRLNKRQKLVLARVFGASLQVELNSVLV